MTLLEALAAVLLVAGSALVFYVVWSADGGESASAQAELPTQSEARPLRRAA